MADPYTYTIDTSEWDGVWQPHSASDERTDHGRSSEDLARAVLEGWILDHPEKVTGGARVTVFGDDRDSYPDDQVTNLRVQIFRDPEEDAEREASRHPEAVAYLVDET